MKRLFVAATVALMLVVWVGTAFAHGRDRRSRRGRDERASRRRSHVRSERSRRHETRRSRTERSRTERSRKAHTRHRTRVYYFPSDYGSGRARAYNDECD